MSAVDIIPIKEKEQLRKELPQRDVRLNISVVVQSFCLVAFR